MMPVRRPSPFANISLDRPDVAGQLGALQPPAMPQMAAMTPMPALPPPPAMESPDAGGQVAQLGASLLALKGRMGAQKGGTLAALGKVGS